MIEYVGNCANIIDWDSVIRDCENVSPEYIGPKHKRGDDIPGLDPVVEIWEKAGYRNSADGGTVGWDMFFPGKQFDQSVVDKFSEFVGIENSRAVWISRIHPGRFAPMHWDVNDDEEELSKLPDPIRFHCHIGKPSFGHIFIVEDKCFYNEMQGSTYKWPSRKSWHAGTNCGLVSKYILNYW